MQRNHPVMEPCLDGLRRLHFLPLRVLAFQSMICWFSLRLWALGFGRLFQFCSPVARYVVLCSSSFCCRMKVSIVFISQTEPHLSTALSPVFLISLFFNFLIMPESSVIPEKSFVLFPEQVEKSQDRSMVRPFKTQLSEKRRSYKSHSDMKDRNSTKDPSDLTMPPVFSELSNISLKSPVRNHGASRPSVIDLRVCHTPALFALSVSP